MQAALLLLTDMQAYSISPIQQLSEGSLSAGAMVPGGDSLSGVNRDFCQRGRRHCGVPALQAQLRDAQHA